MNTIELYLPKSRYWFKLGRKLHRFSGPSCWEELSAKQAIGLVRYLQGYMEQPALVFPLLQLIYSIKPRQARYLFDDAWLRSWGFGKGHIHILLQYGQSLINTLEWSHITRPGARFLVNSFRLYDFQYGTWRVLFRRPFARRQYWAPDEAMGDATFEEFMYADRAYEARNLAQLAAVLYRPKQAGKREAFDEQTLDARTKRFAQLDPTLLELIGGQFYAVKQELQYRFGFVFPTDPLTEVSDKKGSWLDVMIGMAKHDATKVEPIGKLNLYLAIKVLNDQLRQAKELEAELEKIKTKK